MSLGGFDYASTVSASSTSQMRVQSEEALLHGTKGKWDVYAIHIGLELSLFAGRIQHKRLRRSTEPLSKIDKDLSSNAARQPQSTHLLRKFYKNMRRRMISDVKERNSLT